jgi:hypothetical protein
MLMLRQRWLMNDKKSGGHSEVLRLWRNAEIGEFEYREMHTGGIWFTSDAGHLLKHLSGL